MFKLLILLEMHKRHSARCATPQQVCYPGHLQHLHRPVPTCWLRTVPTPTWTGADGLLHLESSELDSAFFPSRGACELILSGQLYFSLFLWFFGGVWRFRTHLNCVVRGRRASKHWRQVNGTHKHTQKQRETGNERWTQWHFTQCMTWEIFSATCHHLLLEWLTLYH